MNRNRPRPSAGSGSLMTLLLLPLRGRGPLLFSLSVVLAVLVFGTVWVWNFVGPQVLDTPEYRLDAREIVVDPSPAWITAEELKQQVIRDASLDPSLSMLDDKLTERIALAFAAHPWVLQVQRVEKFHPARVVVTLQYRIPVAAVAVAGEFLPIDRAAVLLPRENMPQPELARLPRIGGITTHPGLRPGNVWQDVRVEAAALIAEALSESWQQFDLAEIRPSPQASDATEGAVGYELVTRAGKRIAWGRQPLVDDPSEPAPAEKIKRLKAYFEQHGTLDGVALRQGPRASVPHTASAGKPAQ